MYAVSALEQMADQRICRGLVHGIGFYGRYVVEPGSLRSAGDVDGARPRRPGTVGGVESGGYDDDADALPRIEILADADRPGGFVLLLDRVRQSYVDLDDPTYLEFEYMRWMAHAIDLLPAGALTVTHVGGGAGTMARYVAVQRPGSSQITLEPDEELTALVRAQLPFPRGGRLRIRAVRGRPGLAELGDNSADCLVLDAFAGARVPADLTTVECAQQFARVLRRAGMLLANVGDGSGLAYTKRMVAGLQTVLPELAVITDKTVLSGRRFGNVVVVASAVPLPIDELKWALAREPFPVQCRTGSELAGWLGAPRPFTDDDASRSPAPPHDSWRVAPE